MLVFSQLLMDHLICDCGLAFVFGVYPTLTLYVGHRVFNGSIAATQSAVTPAVISYLHHEECIRRKSQQEFDPKQY